MKIYHFQLHIYHDEDLLFLVQQIQVFHIFLILFLVKFIQPNQNQQFLHLFLYLLYLILYFLVLYLYVLYLINVNKLMLIIIQKEYSKLFLHLINVLILLYKNLNFILYNILKLYNKYHPQHKILQIMVNWDD